MASTVDICNSALNMLGGATIISLTENSKNGRLCNQRYEPVRDAIFRSHPWNCLIKRIDRNVKIDSMNSLEDIKNLKY